LEARHSLVVVDPVEMLEHQVAGYMAVADAALLLQTDLESQEQEALFV
jgi:hypothetical protein